MANARRRKSEREAIRVNVNLTAAVAIWRANKVALGAAPSSGNTNISIVDAAANLTWVLRALRERKNVRSQLHVNAKNSAANVKCDQPTEFETLNVLWNATDRQ